jgi:hypothetical protein
MSEQGVTVVTGSSKARPVSHQFVVVKFVDNLAYEVVSSKWIVINGSGWYSWYPTDVSQVGKILEKHPEEFEDGDGMVTNGQVAMYPLTRPPFHTHRFPGEYVCYKVSNEFKINSGRHKKRNQCSRAACPGRGSRPGTCFYPCVSQIELW